MINREDSVLIARESRNRGTDPKSAKSIAQPPAARGARVREVTLYDEARKDESRKPPLRSGKTAGHR